MPLEISKENEGTLQECYALKFIENEHSSKTIRLLPGTYKMLEDHFKPKTKRKDKQPAPAPSLEDVRAYFKSKGYSLEAANKFHEYYETTSWRGANGAPILNWKGKALSVWFVDKNKIQSNEGKSSFFRS